MKKIRLLTAVFLAALLCMVLLVLSVSADTYSGDAICADHAWDGGNITVSPTSTTDGVKIYTCTVCGQMRTEAVPQIFPDYLKSASVTVSSDLRYNVYAILPEGVNDAHVVFTFDGRSVEVTGVLQDDGRVKYTFGGILPQQMGMTVMASLTLTLDGVTVTQTHSGSVEQYAKKLLQSNQYEGWHALLKAMLDYGAAAQAVAGQVSDFVNEGVNEPSISVDRTKLEAIYQNGSGDVWTSAALMLDNQIILKIGVNAPKGVKQIMYTIGNKTIVTPIVDGYAYIPVKAAEMMSEIVLNCYDGVASTADSEMKISASYYLTIATSENGEMNALFDAIAAYTVMATDVAVGHHWTSATCKTPKNCSVCGISVGEALGHTEVVDSAVAPTCSKTGLTEGSHCSGCGEIFVAQEIVAATGEHTFSEWVTTKEATTTEEGLMERSCDCGEKEKQIIEKIIPELEYALNDDGESYSVTGIGTWVDAELVIPATYKGLPVTSVAGDAFYGCRQLTSIVIPDSISHIGATAFMNCDNITSIIIPDNVTIDYCSFGRCDNLNSVIIGKNVIFNRSYAFDYCTKLTSVVIGDGATSIGEYAFNECTSLTSVTIPGSVTSIGSGVFSRCSALTNITFEGIAAQWNAITKGKSWDYDTGLYTVYCTDGIITKDGTVYYYVNAGSHGLAYTLNSDGKSYSVTGIGVCTATDIVIPSEYNNLSVTGIDGGAFYDCNSITSVTIPDSVTRIGNAAFYGCDSLTTIEIPNSIVSIGYMAFEWCSSLKNLYITDLESWLNIDRDSSSYVFSKTGGNLYINGILATDIVIPDSITSIDHYAFYNCLSITSVIIPDSVTTISYGAFYNCSNLTSVTISDSITLIENYVFYNCSSLASIKYCGTQTQWDAITKYSMWDKDSSSYTITYNYTDEG